jgi:hypothetical protein
LLVVRRRLEDVLDVASHVCKSTEDPPSIYILVQNIGTNQLDRTYCKIT